MTAEQPRWRKILLVVAGVAMAALILGEGLGRWGYERGAPGLLEVTGSQDAEVYAREAQRYFERARYDPAVQYARAALDRAPLNQKAMRTLGLSQVALGAQEQGRRAIQAAGRLGWHDVATLSWLMWDGLQRGDFRDSMLRADALARRGTMTSGLFKVIAGFGADDRTRPLLIDRLKIGSGWRGEFFRFANAATPSEADTAEMLLRELAKSPTKPVREEVAPLVRRMVALGAYDRALGLSRDLLGNPRPGIAVSDGDFKQFDLYDERSLFRTPFEGELANTPGATAVVERPDDPEDGALYVESNGARNGVVLASKIVTAPAGSRQLTYTMRSSDRAAPERFQWELTCLGDGSALIGGTAAEPLPSDEPQQRSIAFTVPAGCAYQQLRLVSRGAQQRSTLGAYVDNVAIR